MPTNFYFQSGVPGGRTSEQLLMEEIIIECLKIYGFDVEYISRQSASPDEILNEDVLNTYEDVVPLEMYLSNVTGFEGEGDLLTKFGVEIRDTATFILSVRRWEEAVARNIHSTLLTRPSEGDVLYFPLTQSYFEIRRVETRDPFFQGGHLYVYKLECELMQFSSERFTTGEGVDDLANSYSLDMTSYEILLENEKGFLLEHYTPSKLILEEFKLSDIDPSAQNDAFKKEIDILDFSERNPFGEINA